MIRSNPTAIHLRASDVKHLQAELDKRKPTISANTNEPTSTSTSAAPMGPHNAVEAAKQGKKQQTTAERIGL
jgi:hypothetical protein